MPPGRGIERKTAARRLRSTEGSTPGRPKIRRGEVGADGCALRGRTGRSDRPIRARERIRTGSDLRDQKRARPAGHRGHRPRRTWRNRRENRRRLRAWLADRLGRGMCRAWDSYRRDRRCARRAARHATRSASGMPRRRRGSASRWRDERGASSQYGPVTRIAQARLRSPARSLIGTRRLEKTSPRMPDACCTATFYGTIVAKLLMDLIDPMVSSIFSRTHRQQRI